MWRSPTGASRPPPDGRFSEQQLMAQWFPSRSARRQRHPFCNNANAAIRRSLWHEQPYDETAHRPRGPRLGASAAARPRPRALLRRRGARSCTSTTSASARSSTATGARRSRTSRSTTSRRCGSAPRCGSASANLVGDLRARAQAAGCLRGHLFDIAQFRTAQFFGTYRGFAQQGPVPALLKRRFYYPRAAGRSRRRDRGARGHAPADRLRPPSDRADARHAPRADAPRQRARRGQELPAARRPAAVPPHRRRAARVPADRRGRDRHRLRPLSPPTPERRSPRSGVIARPEHLLGGDVPMNDVLLNDIDQVPADLYVQTHSTNPLLRSATIAAALEALLASGGRYDSLFTVTPLHTRLWTPDGEAINHDPDGPAAHAGPAAGDGGELLPLRLRRRHAAATRQPHRRAAAAVRDRRRRRRGTSTRRSTGPWSKRCTRCRSRRDEPTSSGPDHLPADAELHRRVPRALRGRRASTSCCPTSSSSRPRTS